MQIRIGIALLVLSTSAFAQTKLEKELQTPYKRVMEQDLAYIVTPEERQAFDRLGSDEERDQFIEQFWLRRDPTPDTEENEFREEHYRRIAYSNERFASGAPGWRSDRGRIYIMYGPADEIESHPSGGSYQRPPEQGSGTTSTFPFEQWRYRYLANVGTNVIVEFVDPTMTGEYRMTMDPSEKDALAHVPGYARPITAQPSDAFDRLKLYSDLQRPPSQKFTDLEAAVNSRVAFNVLPMKVRQDFFRLTDATVLSNITIQFENNDLQFEPKDGVERAVIRLSGRITTLTRRSVNTFERTLEVSAPGGLLGEFRKQHSIFQESIPLAPGTYRVNLVAQVAASGSLQNYEAVLTVPRFEEGKLAMGSIVLADSIERVSTRSTGAGQFTIGSLKVRPRVSAIFRPGETMALYSQIYNAEPHAQVEYEIVRQDNGARVLFAADELVGQVVQKEFSLGGLAPGKYELRMKVAGVSGREAFAVE